MVKPTTMLWIESGACSGESMAILGLDVSFATKDCDLAQFLENEHIRLLWHPSLCLDSPRQLLDIVDSIVARKEDLTLFCVEGSIIHGPNGTGMFDSIHGKPKKELIHTLCCEAEYVLAMGTCAAFGGIPAAPPNPTESSGLQFSLAKPGGLLTPEWLSRAGFPVINLSGCPVDAVTMLRTMSSIVNGGVPALDKLNRPSTVRPCLSDESCRKCGTAAKVGYSCYNCIGATFPVNKRLFRHADCCQQSLQGKETLFTIAAT
jgi:Ni,Fe-hydrogenase I small subunit